MVAMAQSAALMAQSILSLVLSFVEFVYKRIRKAVSKAQPTRSSDDAEDASSSTSALLLEPAWLRHSKSVEASMAGLHAFGDGHRRLSAGDSRSSREDQEEEEADRRRGAAEGSSPPPSLFNHIGRDRQRHIAALDVVAQQQQYFNEMSTPYRGGDVGWAGGGSDGGAVSPFQRYDAARLHVESQLSPSTFYSKGHGSDGATTDEEDQPQRVGHRRRREKGAGRGHPHDGDGDGGRRVASRPHPAAVVEMMGISQANPLAFNRDQQSVPGVAPLHSVAWLAAQQAADERDPYARRLVASTKDDIKSGTFLCRR